MTFSATAKSGNLFFLTWQGKIVKVLLYVKTDLFIKLSVKDTGV